MPERLAIAEAPTVQLGREGVNQYLPVAEETPGERHAAPGKTSIQLMAEFFGIVPATLDIQRFFLNNATRRDVDIPNNFARGAFTQPLRLNWTATGRVVLSGNPDAFSIGNGAIIPAQSGLYIMQLYIQGEYFSDKAGNGPAVIMPTMNVVLTPNIETIAGFPLTSTPGDEILFPILSQGAITFPVEANAQIATQIFYTNLGGTPADQDGTEVISARAGVGVTASAFTITRVG